MQFWWKQNQPQVKKGLLKISWKISNYIWVTIIRPFNYNNYPNNLYEKYECKDFSISPAPQMFDEFLSNLTEYQEHGQRRVEDGFVGNDEGYNSEH